VSAQRAPARQWAWVAISVSVPACCETTRTESPWPTSVTAPPPSRRQVMPWPARGITVVPVPVRASAAPVRSAVSPRARIVVSCALATCTPPATTTAFAVRLTGLKRPSVSAITTSLVPGRSALRRTLSRPVASSVGLVLVAAAVLSRGPSTVGVATVQRNGGREDFPAARVDDADADRALVAEDERVGPVAHVERGVEPLRAGGELLAAGHETGGEHGDAGAHGDPAAAGRRRDVGRARGCGT
jgi:hypothetical protein